jgi:hypothetical protein
MALSGDMCDRIIAAAEHVTPVKMAGDLHPDLHLDPDDEAGLLARALAANRQWWRHDIAAWSISAKRYQAGMGMMQHSDWHPRDSYRRLTLIVQISDPATYRGGDLKITFQGTTMAEAIPPNRGDFS